MSLLSSNNAGVSIITTDRLHELNYFIDSGLSKSLHGRNLYYSKHVYAYNLQDMKDLKVTILVTFKNNNYDEIESIKSVSIERRNIPNTFALIDYTKKAEIYVKEQALLQRRIKNTFDKFDKKYNTNSLTMQETYKNLI